MNDQAVMDAREVMIALKFLPPEERLKLQGVIYGMRLARNQATQPPAPAVRPSAQRAAVKGEEVRIE